ncbi:MAG TPA: polysaccharide deacetylase family protein, partial [Bacteroidales bacterium]|nr:polysaccharide deacetylase family protein [Bacteroidales bacterium]
KTNLFRPPFGVTNPNIARAVNSLNYTVIGWNIRSLDTVRKNTAGTVKIVKRKLRPGSIILLHDNHERIIPTLTGVIEAALEKGYTFVRPDEMLNLKAYK